MADGRMADGMWLNRGDMQGTFNQWCVSVLLLFTNMDSSLVHMLC